jgi:hypothetical protein
MGLIMKDGGAAITAGEEMIAPANEIEAWLAGP